MPKLIAAGIVLISAASLAPVVPQSMNFQAAYQLGVGGQNDSLATVNASSTIQYTDDGTHMISVAVFKDVNGNEVDEQIPNSQYSLMGKVSGNLQNPTKNDFITPLQAALLATPAHAAIATDSSSKGVRVNAQSITWTCTVTGSNLISIIEVGQNNQVDQNITTATINGAAATLIDRSFLASGGQGNMALFFKFGPTTGNCVGSISGGVNHVMDGMEESYTGVIQSGTYSNSSATSVLLSYQNATTSSNGTSFTQTSNPCATGSWLVWFVQNDSTVPTAGTNFTIRQSDTAGAAAIGDTNGTVSGSTGMTATNGTAINWEGIQASIAPVGATCAAAATAPTDPGTLILFQ